MSYRTRTDRAIAGGLMLFGFLIAVSTAGAEGQPGNLWAAGFGILIALAGFALWHWG